MSRRTFLRVYFTGRLITEKHGKPNVMVDGDSMVVIERKLKYNAIKSKIRTSYKIITIMNKFKEIRVHSDNSFELISVSHITSITGGNMHCTQKCINYKSQLLHDYKMTKL